MHAPENMTVENEEKASKKMKNEIVLLILVRNHPGVMSQVCGLFSRRAYNLESIAVLPVGNGAHSKIWLQVAEEEKLDQIVKQLMKLPDVQEVKHCTEEETVFTAMAPFS